MTEEESRLCSILTREPMHIDLIARETGLPVYRILDLLLSLELKGVTRQANGKRFYLSWGGAFARNLKISKFLRKTIKYNGFYSEEVLNIIITAHFLINRTDKLDILKSFPVYIHIWSSFMKNKI